MRTLYLIRGLPGSGKTTLAKQLTDQVFEADQFFEQPDGTYRFDRASLGEAHAWCRARTESAMQDEKSIIAVSNTFTQHWEMGPYIGLAALYGYQVQEITMSGPLRPNVHGVPPEAIARMRDRWER